MNYTMPKNEEHCTEMFSDSIMGGAGTWVECQCGIDHYAVDSEYNDEDYSAPDESDTVRHHFFCDGISYGNLDGQIFVWECDGCKKKLKRYEDFIWNSRSEIRRYLKTRIDQEKVWADQEHLLNTLAGI